MLTLLRTPTNQLAWQSPQLHTLGVPHAFLSRAWNIQHANDARAAADDLALPPGSVHLSTQCHGATVTTPERREHEDPAPADAHLTDRAAEYVAVRTADCVPILLAGPHGQCVAAVHAGWRGLVAGVLEAAVHAMQHRGHPPVVAAVGPCISVTHYEVGEEVATQFHDAHLDHTLGAKPHLNLRAATLTRLINAGLPPAAIDLSDVCTHAHPDTCFSYRRDGRTGHHAALIAPSPKSLN